MRSGGTGNGYAKVLRWNGTEWVQLGNTITGSTGEGYGRTVAIEWKRTRLLLGVEDQTILVNMEFTLWSIIHLDFKRWKLYPR